MQQILVGANDFYHWRTTAACGTGLAAPGSQQLERRGQLLDGVCHRRDAVYAITLTASLSASVVRECVLGVRSLVVELGCQARAPRRAQVVYLALAISTEHRKHRDTA